MSNEEELLLISVEDLIHRSIGDRGKNCGYVDFKGVQTILHLLARQMRMLEQKVEIRVEDLEDLKAGEDYYSDTSQEGVQKSVTETDKKDKFSKKGREKVVTGQSSQDRSQEKSKISTEDENKYSQVGGDETQVKDIDVESYLSEGFIMEEEIPYRSEDDQKSPRTKKSKQSRTKKSAVSEASQETSTSQRSKPKSKASRVTQEAVTPKQSQTKSKDKKKEQGISVKEKKSKDDSVLVVERAKVSVVSSGIEVVTRSQFNLLAAAVEELHKMAAPAPAPQLPDNKQLRDDMKHGRASLSDAMSAMNVNARVDAAEAAIQRLSSLVTQLTTAGGGLPRGIISKVTADESNIHQMESQGRPSRVVAIESRPSTMSRRPSARPSSYLPSAVASSVSPVYVSHEEMEYQFQSAREELMKALALSGQRAAATAEIAYGLARSIGDKMDVALSLNKRISSIFSKVLDYAEQLKGFDSGIGIQLQGFQDQMQEMKEELKNGLDLMDKTHSTAENAAIVELTERYEALVADLDQTVSGHQALSIMQGQLSDEMKALVECVEMLREQKADRDEVLDALRDKADLSRLAGLLGEEQFTSAKVDLEDRLKTCYEKFQKQEDVWLLALKELSNELETKADKIQLYTVRGEAAQGLQMLLDLADVLAEKLGEPKAAVVLRGICRGAVCAACAAPALMSPGGGAGADLPAFVPAAAHPPRRDQPPEEYVQHYGHRCNRWAGGSHTLLAPQRVVRTRAAPLDSRTTTVKYFGYGDDGSPYYLEEACVPCEECNPPPSRSDEHQPRVDAAGDKCTPIPVQLTIEEVPKNK